MTDAFVASAGRHEARHMADEKVMPRGAERFEEHMMSFAMELGMSIERPNILVADSAWRALSA